MSTFDAALAILREHEGGWSDDGHDSGGATNFGISLKFLRLTGTVDADGDGYMDGDIDYDGDIDADDIRLMDAKRAGAIYREQFWDRYRYDRIVDQAIATKTFDMSVNMGPRASHRCLQRACRAVLIVGVIDDGIIGPRTRAAVNSAPQAALLAAFRSEAAGYYRRIPAQYGGRYLDGWLNRAYS